MIQRTGAWARHHVNVDDLLATPGSDIGHIDTCLRLLKEPGHIDASSFTRPPIPRPSILTLPHSKLKRVVSISYQNRQKTGTRNVATTKNHNSKGSPSFA
jgi:hypothetical protein